MIKPLGCSSCARASLAKIGPGKRGHNARERLQVCLENNFISLVLLKNPLWGLFSAPSVDT